MLYVKKQGKLLHIESYLRDALYCSHLGSDPWKFNNNTVCPYESVACHADPNCGSVVNDIECTNNDFGSFERCKLFSACDSINSTLQCVYKIKRPGNLSKF